MRICEGQRNSIFDLTWASEGLRIQYGGELDYPGSDHRVQCMSVANMGDTVCLRKTVPEDWSWIKTNKRRIREEIKEFRDPGIFAISEAIDKVIDILVMQFQNITDLSIPRCKAQRG